MSPVKPITMFKFSYTPMFPNKDNAIRSVDVFISAETREEAELESYKGVSEFFNNDVRVEVTAIAQGYKQE